MKTEQIITIDMSLKITIDEDAFKYVDRKNFVCIESEYYGDLSIEAIQKKTNGEWKMCLNGYEICSYRGGNDIPSEDNINFSILSELDESERLGFYQEFIICQRQIEKKMIYKTDGNYKYNFNANVIPLFFEVILCLIKRDLKNIFADRVFDNDLEKSKYVGNDVLKFINPSSYDEMMKVIDALLQDNEPYWKKNELLDNFEKDTGAIIYKYGHYRLVSDLSKFLKQERILLKNKKLKDYGPIFSPEFIVTHLRDKSGVKFNIGKVRTAVTRNKKQ
jgi:hypothetical protein